MRSATYTIECINSVAQITSPILALTFFVTPGAGIFALIPYLSLITVAAGVSHLFHGIFQRYDTQQTGIGKKRKNSKGHDVTSYSYSQSNTTSFNKKIAAAEIGVGALLSGYGIFSYTRLAAAVANTTAPAALLAPAMMYISLGFAVSAWAQFLTDLAVLLQLSKKQSYNNEVKKMLTQAIVQFYKTVAWTGLSLATAFASPLLMPSFFQTAITVVASMSGISTLYHLVDCFTRGPSQKIKEERTFSRFLPA